MQRQAPWMVIAALLVPALAWADDGTQPGIRLPATLPPLAETPAPNPRLLGPGSRVRIVSTVAGKVRGNLAQVDETSMTLHQEDGGAIVIPRTSVVKVEVSLGRQRRTRKGLLIGVVTGALVGLLLPVDPDNCSPESPNLCSRQDAVGLMVVGGAAYGAGIGALVKGDRWAPVGFAPPVPASSNSARPAGGLAFRWRF